MAAATPKLPKYLLISNETVETEKTFVGQMETALLVFVRPLAENKHIIDAMTHQALFSNIETLHQFNSELMSSLVKDMETNAAGGRRIGKIFKQFAPFFKMFTLYLNNFEKAMDLLKRLKEENLVFKNFVEHAEKDPRCKGHNLMTFLITPVQRVPRYKLLLEDLLKAMPDSEEDKKDLKEALELVSQSAKHNNEMIRRRENQDKVLEIQQSFTENTRIDLLDNPSRLFIKMGTMTKLSRRGPQPHMFWLFNDIMLYGDQKLDGSYKVNREIKLLKCQVSSPTDEELEAANKLGDGNSEFSLSCMISLESDQKSFVAYAESKEEKTKWVASINDAIEQMRVKYKHDTGQLAPVWRPNSTASACTCCGKKFSWTFRKHHCRNCGIVVCDNCSGSRIMLRHIDEKYKVRVCDGCAGKGKLSDGGAQNDDAIKEFLAKLDRSAYNVGPPPTRDPPELKGDRDVDRPEWAFGAVKQIEVGVKQIEVGAPVLNDELRMQSFRPTAPAPAAAPPPPPPAGVEVKQQPEEIKPPEKPKKPAKPAKPPKPKPAAGEPPPPQKPVVPKRPARFSRTPTLTEPDKGMGQQTTPSFSANPMAASSEGRLYPLSLLQDKANLPPNVDPRSREMYLVDLEFLDVFGCTKASFEKKPEWQKTQLKKKANLF